MVLSSQKYCWSSWHSCANLKYKMQSSVWAENIHTYIHAHTHTYIHTYTHTHMYIHAHTYIRTYMQVTQWSFNWKHYFKLNFDTDPNYAWVYRILCDRTVGCAINMEDLSLNSFWNSVSNKQFPRYFSLQFTTG